MKRHDVFIAGHKLSEFRAKMQSYPSFSSDIDSDIFHGSERSSMQLLHLRRNAMHMTCVIDYHGDNAERTANQSTLESLLIAPEPVKIDIGDGFHYLAVLEKPGSGNTLGEICTSVEYTFRVTRHKDEVAITTPSGHYNHVFCPSNVPKTDVKVYIPYRSGVTGFIVRLNDLTFEYTGAMTGNLLLDGVNKIFKMGSTNITNTLEWVDFPYFVPGDNEIVFSTQGVTVATGCSVRFLPTFM